LGENQLICVPSSALPANVVFLLAFNMIGVVDVTDQDTHHVVNVEFHDKGADRRGYHFQDHNRFSLAAIGQYR
jgi:chromosome transmission fidelity protein 4